MSLFLETIRLYNGQFAALEYHQERLRRTFSSFFPSAKVIDLRAELASTDFPIKGLYKCRVVYDSQIRKIEFIPYLTPIIRTLKLIESNFPDSYYKTVDRSYLNGAFSLRGKCDDILLVKNGLLTDTSFCNIALSDGNEWITPKTPLLYGTMRAQLLDSGLLKEKDIHVEDLKQYKQITLFNAMIDMGQIVLNPVNALQF